MFAFLCSHAIHLAIANSLETDSFVLELRGFVGHKRSIQHMLSDNENNFVSAVKELRNAFHEMDHAQIQRQMQNLGENWMIWL